MCIRIQIQYAMVVVDIVDDKILCRNTVRGVKLLHWYCQRGYTLYANVCLQYSLQ